MRSQPIRLGVLSYVLASKDEKLVERCTRLFEQVVDRTAEDGGKAIVVDLDRLMEEMGSLEAIIHPILARAAAEQPPGIWVDAATLRFWNGKNLLLMGASYSGKSTLAFACWAYLSCRIVCEDVTLIDIDSNTIVPFCRPVSLREGALNLIGFDSTELVTEGEWIVAPTMYCNKPVEARFDLAIFLDGQPHAEPILIEEITPDGFLHAALPLSNLVRTNKGIGQFTADLPANRCYRITEGSVQERIDFVRQAIS